MKFDQENHVVKLCATGMEMEGQGRNEDALALFQQAWTEARDDFEKFIAAHYLARHQPSTLHKLAWDEAALAAALKVDDNSIKENYPSLYLNIAKCYEDLNDPDNARKNYQLALSYAHLLPGDGYGNMIRAGIEKGIQRVS